jgi:hypothetical protein
MLHDLRSSPNHPSSGHVLLHEPHALILLEKVCQLIFDDCFDFLLRVLLLVLLDFDGLVLLRGGGRVFRAEVFMESTSALVVGRSTGSAGHLASMVATWGSVDGCGWAIWGMCVVWTVV